MRSGRLGGHLLADDDLQLLSAKWIRKKGERGRGREGEREEGVGRGSWLAVGRPRRRGAGGYQGGRGGRLGLWRGDDQGEWGEEEGCRGREKGEAGRAAAGGEQ